MSDLEKFVELYKSVGIEVEVYDEADGTKTIYLEAKTHEKLEGYDGFCTAIHFDKDGKFVSQAFWE